MNPEIHVFPTAETAAREAGGVLTGKLAYTGPILFLASGGSALDVLKSTSVQYIDGRVTISVLDERFSPDPRINNFAQLSQTDFFKYAVAQGAKTIDTRVREGETLEALAQRFEEALQNIKGAKIVITQGIGKDGHTAGIFPNMHFDNNRWVKGYEAKDNHEYPRRVTTTFAFFRMVDEAIVYACGKEKEQALTQTMSPHGSLEQTPARIIHEIGHVALFTDLPVSR